MFVDCDTFENNDGPDSNNVDPLANHTRTRSGRSIKIPSYLKDFEA